MRVPVVLIVAFIACVVAQQRDWWTNVRSRFENARTRLSNNLLGGGESGTGGWGATFFVPGHTLQSDSFGMMVKHAMGSPSNGPYAAVWDAGKRGWFRLRLTPNAFQRQLTVEQLRRDGVKLFSIDFSDRFAGVQKKAREIATSLTQIRSVLGNVDGQSTPISIVTHSAGDADFDTAAVNGYIRGFRIVNRIAIGPVFDGTFMGDIGKAVLPRLGGVGDALGSQAASELAENSKTVLWLQRNQLRLNRSVYLGTRRVDILTEGKGLKLSPRLDRGAAGQGDGFVQSSQRRPYVTQTIVVRVLDPTFVDHFSQPMYRGVIEQVDRILRQRN